MGYLRMRLRRFAALLFLVMLATGAAAQAGGAFSDDPEVQAFIREMVRRHDFDRSRLDDLIGRAQVSEVVLRAISKPAEAKPWYAYRPIFVTAPRIDAGVQFWRSHEESLRRAESEFGIAPEIIVAIIGVESRFGSHRGTIRVLDSLATLAFRYPRRARFFRSELSEFLLLTREEGLDPLELKGSYAGAMGLPQFISSSYRRYAVDFDGDNVRDLLGNTDDAIGSVANYLKQHGWRRGGGIASKISEVNGRISQFVDKGLKPHSSVRHLRQSGLRFEAASENEKAAVVQLEQKSGYEYWVALQNFYVITRYNHSPLYAMAVYQLAQEIRSRFGESENTDG